MGRPSVFTQEIADEIATRLASGEPMASICRDEKMPGVTTVWEWQKAKPEFSEIIARAREVGFDEIAARARLTARGKASEEGGDSTSDVQRDKLIIDTDLKLLSKWDPKRYGDKVAHVGGGDGDAPIKSELKVTFV